MVTYFFTGNGTIKQEIRLKTGPNKVESFKRATQINSFQIVMWKKNKFIAQFVKKKMERRATLNAFIRPWIFTVGSKGRRTIHYFPEMDGNQLKF